MTTFQLTKELFKTVGYLALILLALAITLGTHAYDAGMAFRRWCDRLVEDSQRVKIAGYLPFAAVEVEDADDTAAIVAEWRKLAAAHLQMCDEAVAQAADRLAEAIA